MTGRERWSPAHLLPYGLRIGTHLSTSGSLEKAGLRAAEIGANTLQIFSSSPRMWKASTLSTDAITALKRVREKHDLHPLVIHDSYLINMASCDEAIRAKSVAAFRGEIERALAMNAEYLVAHPGSCKGHTVESGIQAFCQSVGEAAQEIDTRGLTLLIENTAGSGNILGSRFEELVELRNQAGRFTDLKIGFCIDTCHCLAAGYELKAAVKLMDSILGMDNIHVIHANDSKAPLGSRVDRHEIIGKGHIGDAAFRFLLRHPMLSEKAFIAETPMEPPFDEAWTVQKLISLSKKARG